MHPLMTVEQIALAMLHGTGQAREAQFITDKMAIGGVIVVGGEGLAARAMVIEVNGITTSLQDGVAAIVTVNTHTETNDIELVIEKME